MSFNPRDDDATFLYELQRDRKSSKLVSYLKKSDEAVVRRRAAEILADFDDLEQDHEQERVVRGLIEAVKHDDDPEVRARAIDALDRHGTAALEKLVSDVSGTDLDETPEWVTARTVTDWLESDHPEFRMVAAVALGKMGAKSAVPELVAAFEDPDPRVRARAIEACGAAGDPRCVEPLSGALTDSNPIVRQAAARALGDVGTKSALEALVPVARADSESLRQIAVGELGKLTEPKAVIVLIKCVEDDTDAVQRSAILSLVRLLSEVPESETDRVRTLVADQLSTAETDAVVPQLVDLVNEPGQRRARRNATWLLGHVAEEYREDVVESLLAAIDADDDQTARFAAAGLVAIDGDELAKQLRIRLQNEEGSPAALDRVESVLKEMDATAGGELVTNSVEYTYVADPRDYTDKKRTSRDDDSSE